MGYPARDFEPRELAEREGEFVVGSIFIEARDGTMKVRCETVKWAFATREQRAAGVQTNSAPRMKSDLNLAALKGARRNHRPAGR